jgi:uncharacterized protein (TIGR02246 family)
MDEFSPSHKKNNMKNQFKYMALSAACLLISLSGIAQGQRPGNTAVRQDIQDMENAFARAEKNKDANGVASYYSSDATSYSHDRKPSVGKDAITKSIRERLTKDSTGNTNVYKVVDVFAEGNMLVEIGSWEVLSPAGKTVNTGFYMSYFEKKNGKYLCVRDMNIMSNK